MSQVPSQYLPALAAAADPNGFVSRTAAIKAIASRVDHATPDGPMVWAAAKLNRYISPRPKTRAPMLRQAWSVDGEPVYVLTDHCENVLRHIRLRAEHAERQAKRERRAAA